ncbi:hypothetical protein AZL_025430 [Azospirillum sp. B510]|uniref:hypothetical protein n=1 Tax=Azospirillum sp. (strain B510) TaxID=137722 RepID=UPI0001C4CBED|nr:hypothetical protein [Azospirillum sp. B510]BAI73181.1 hypothetical protein AZL_025430 [Azospirillum sp. B510]
MADFYGTNHALTVATPRSLVNGGDFGGSVRVYTDSYTTLGTEAVGDSIYVGYLKPGERFLFGIVVFGALGASTTLQLGDAGDDDRYMAAGSTAAAGNKDARALAGAGFLNDTDTAISLCLKVGGATLAAGIGIRTELFISRV